MPIIDAQRKHETVGAIRMGCKIKTDYKDKNGKPIYRPTKLDRFRITSPTRSKIEQVAARFGGEVKPWDGHYGPEWEVIISSDELPVFVPRQNIDPNYEYWTGKAKSRLCDGAVERKRGQACLCRQPNNHEHRFSKGICMLCGVDQSWSGPDHVHDFDVAGKCSVCGCGRICKPTTRLSLMIHGINGLGYWKLESHGFNAAMELPALAGVIGNLTDDDPLLAVLKMRFEERIRLTFVNGRETMQTFKFFVPSLNFFTLKPADLYAASYELAASSRAGLENPVFRGLSLEAPKSTEPALPTRDDVLGWVESADSLDELRETWSLAKQAGLLDQVVKTAIERRKVQLAEVVDAEIIE
jgi:hypothetical protein